MILFLLLPTVRGQQSSESSSPAPGPEDEVVYKSPKGTYKIQSSRHHETDWIVSVKDPSDFKVLPEGIVGMDAAASPDEKWLFYSGELYRKGVGLKFIPFKGTHWLQKNAVADAAKRFHFARVDIVTSSGRWSCDSGRVLLEIFRTHENEEAERYVYFNVRTNAFEETPYLQMVNATLAQYTGAARFERYPSPNNSRSLKHMVFAEPLDPLPPETELRSRFESLDSRMNELHKKSLLSSHADTADIVRNAQQKWDQARAEAIRLYLPFGPKDGQERYRLQFLCDLTAEGLRQFED